MQAIYVNAKGVSWEDMRRQLAELRGQVGAEAEIYFDEAGRGRRFDALIARIKAGGIDEVLVYSPDRLGDSEPAVRQATRQIESHGAGITFLNPQPEAPQL